MQSCGSGVPEAKGIQGLGFFKNKLNAAQFSKLFKGNLSRLSPKTRGVINRIINKDFVRHNIWNGNIPNGGILSKSIDIIDYNTSD